MTKERRLGRGQRALLQCQLAQCGRVLGVVRFDLQRLLDRGDGLVDKSQTAVGQRQAVQACREVGAHLDGFLEKLKDFLD